MPSEKLYRDSGERVIVYNTESDPTGLAGEPADSVSRGYHNTAFRSLSLSLILQAPPTCKGFSIHTVNYRRINLWENEWEWGQRDCCSKDGRNGGIWVKTKRQDKILPRRISFIFGTRGGLFHRCLGQYSAAIGFQVLHREPRRKKG